MSASSTHTPLRAALAGMLAMAAALGIGRFVYTPILPPMAAALGLSKALAGWIGSANYIGYLVGALAAGHPALSRDARRWLIGALAISGLSTVAMGLAGGFPAFLALRFIGGAASAFVLVYAAAVVLRRLAEVGRPGLAALHFAGVGVGIAVSAIVVSAVSAAGGDWRALWIASGALALVIATAAVLLLPPHAPVAARSGPGKAAGGSRITARHPLSGVCPAVSPDRTS